MKTLILEGIHTGVKRQWRLKRTNLKVGDRVVLDCHDWKIIKVIDKPKKKKRKAFWDYGVTYGDWVGNIDTWRGIGYVIEQVNKRKLQELRNRPYFKTIVTEVKGKPSKGENLEKVEFPCYCSYKCNAGEWLGELNKRWIYGVGNRYLLSNINQQRAYSVVAEERRLKTLMDRYDIEILKGELHLWKSV